MTMKPDTHNLDTDYLGGRGRGGGRKQTREISVNEAQLEKCSSHSKIKKKEEKRDENYIIRNKQTNKRYLTTGQTPDPVVSN